MANTDAQTVSKPLNEAQVEHGARTVGNCDELPQILPVGTDSGRSVFCKIVKKNVKIISCRCKESCPHNSV